MRSFFTTQNLSETMS